MIGQQHEIARLQSDFYRTQYLKIVRWLNISIVIMIALICAIIYFIFVAPPTDYYATTTTGQIIPMVPQP